MVTKWSARDNSTLVQIANPSNESVTTRVKLIVGQIVQVTVVDPNGGSSVHRPISVELERALMGAFKELPSQWSSAQPSVLSSSPKELGKCSIMKATVDRRYNLVLQYR